MFTPKHPKTKPELSKVEREEQKLDFEAYVERAMETMQTYRIIAEY